MIAPLETLLGQLAGHLSRPPLVCQDAVPSQRGELLLSLVYRGRPVQARLVSGWGPSDVGLNPLFSGETRLDWIQALRGGLVAARREAFAPWLDRLNREHERVELSAPGLLGLIAFQIEPGKPFWHDWQLAELECVSGPFPRFVFDLVSSQPPGRCLLGLTAGPLPPGETPLMTTPLGTLTRLEEGSAPGREAPASQPEAAVAFVLSRAFHSDMRWQPVEPGSVGAQGDRTGDRTGERTGDSNGEAPNGEARPPEDVNAPPPEGPPGFDEPLIKHCFRSWRHWDSKPSRFFHVWGDQDAFAVTAAGSESLVFVAHASRECPIANGALSSHGALGSTPWEERPSLAATSSEFLVTDTDESSLVFGGEKRLESALDQVADCPVRVIEGCDFNVIGDDTAGICRLKREDGRQVRLLNPPLPRFTDAWSWNWWRDRLASAASTDREPRTVNLAGLDWPDGRVSLELDRLLAAIGVRVRTSFFPGTRADFEGEAGRAQVTIATPWAPVGRVLVPLFAELGFPYLELPSPYGPGGTRAWASAVARAVDLPEPDDATWAALVETVIPDLARLREAASQVELVLVADRGTVAQMCEPEFFYGVDPVRAALDFGFRVRLAGPGAQEEADRQAAAAPGRVSAWECARGENPLPAIVSGKDQLVYCEVGDGAAARAQGAVPFTVRDLEPGLKGARRTLLRLLAKSRLRLLSRTGEAERSPSSGHGIGMP